MILELAEHAFHDGHRCSSGTVLALRRKQHKANISCLCCFWRNANTVPRTDAASVRRTPSHWCPASTCRPRRGSRTASPGTPGAVAVQHDREGVLVLDEGGEALYQTASSNSTSRSIASVLARFASQIHGTERRWQQHKASSSSGTRLCQSVQPLASRCRGVQGDCRRLRF